MIRFLQWGKSRLSGFYLAYTFDVVAWEDWDNRRRSGRPRNPENALGLKVLLTNPDDDGDTHQFWSFTRTHYQSWAEWWVYIAGQMEMHGFGLEDEPPRDGPIEPPPPPEPPKKPPGRIRRWFRKLFGR